MRHPIVAATSAACAACALVSPAQAQSEGGFALSQFEPAPPGDVFFRVPGPAAPGHLEVRGQAMFDYAQRPIRLRTGDDLAVVSSQGFLRFDASLSLWERLLVSVGFPFAVVLNGDDPGIAGTTFTALEAPQPGDLRLGLRVRAFGDDAGPFQVGVGGYFFVPTGAEEQYAGDGKVRGTPQVAVGGRIGSDVAFVYDAALGAALRSAGTPSAITYGAGAGVLFADDLVQVGAEGYGATFLGNELDLSSTPIVHATAGTNAELLFGAKLRVLDGLTFGAGIGPGLGTAVGTPTFRAVGTVGWSPLPKPPPDTENQPKEVGDRDDDGIKDDIDACPDQAGEPNPDPTKDGCPPDDRDRDGVLDVEDACPNTPGLRNVDVTKNGCPKDSDGDGVHDGIDRCPQVPGEMSDDPTKNGCPPDRDDDGIVDTQDACPADKGAPNDDPKRNGCPEDPDGDGITWGEDACPSIAGVADADPRRNGCPAYGATQGPPPQEEVGFHVLFRVSKWAIDDVITMLRPSLAEDIKKKLAEPGVDHIEVQGHTDDSGQDEINTEVSLKRAESLRDWLVGQGVPADRLVAKGYSYTRPVADNRIRQGREENRRVQFVVIRKGK